MRSAEELARIRNRINEIDAIINPLKEERRMLRESIAYIEHYEKTHEKVNRSQITHKHYLYHVTEKENVDNILKEGLKRRGVAVYLSENPLSWWKPNMTILKVRATGLKDRMTRVDEKLDEILVWDDIKPCRIKVLALYGKKLKDAEDKYYFYHPKERRG